MKPMTEQLRVKIKKYIKNRIDISELINGVSIKGEDLSGAIIKSFNRPSDDMARVNLNRTVIGEEGKVTNISGSNLRNSKLCDCTLKGIFYFRRCDARDADFSGMVGINVEYQYTDFRGAKFCETCMRIGSDYGFGAIFDDNLFRDLTKGWNLSVHVKKEGEE